MNKNLSILITILLTYVLVSSLLLLVTNIAIHKTSLHQVKTRSINKSISIELAIYKLDRNGRKELLYRGWDPPTRNLFEAIAFYLGYYYAKVYTVSGQIVNGIPFDSKKPVKPIICIGNGMLNSTFNATNLARPLKCVTFLAMNLTTFKNETVLTVLATILFNESTTISEVGYLVYDGAINDYILLLYDALQPLNISNNTLLIISYRIVFSNEPPLTSSFWSLIADYVFGYSYPSMIYPNAPEIQIDRYRYTVYAYACPYIDISNVTDPDQLYNNITSNCTQLVIVQNGIVNETSNRIILSFYLYSFNEIELGTIALTSTILKYTISGMVEEHHVIALFTISKSNSYVLKPEEVIRLDVSIESG